MASGNLSQDVRTSLLQACAADRVGRVECGLWLFPIFLPGASLFIVALCAVALRVQQIRGAHICLGRHGTFVGLRVSWIGGASVCEMLVDDDDDALSADREQDVVLMLKLLLISGSFRAARTRATGCLTWCYQT